MRFSQRIYGDDPSIVFTAAYWELVLVRRHVLGNSKLLLQHGLKKDPF
jgi:hypothetical protein